VPLSPSSTIWYQPMGWRGNCGHGGK